MISPWRIYDEPGDPKKLRVHLFVSRNKDNAGVAGFRPRRRALLAYDSDWGALVAPFDGFVAAGIPGETVRWYASLNARDPEQVRRQVIHRLLDGAEIARLDSLAASSAAKKACAAEHKWLFDFDDRSENRAVDFYYDVCGKGGFVREEVWCNPTPNGFAVVAARGFDTRELMAEWGSVATLKRDGMLLLGWRTRA